MLGVLGDRPELRQNGFASLKVYVMGTFDGPKAFGRNCSVYF